MGNKLWMMRQMVEDKYIKPQGLYQLKDVDKKKPRKLILDSKLAPCYPGDDECGCDLEECPICFLMRTPNSARPTAYTVSMISIVWSYVFVLVPLCVCASHECFACTVIISFHFLNAFPNLKRCTFCKTVNFAVEYRGIRTKEEKILEQIEEQRVTEAKLRIRKQELLNEEERMLKRREISTSSSRRRPSEVDLCSTTEPSILHGEEVVTCEESHIVSAPLSPRKNREDVVKLDLEDIMVTEAISRSIQEKGRQPHHPWPDCDADLSQEYTVEDRFSSLIAPMVGSPSSSGGIACAIAALAERQQKGREPSNNYVENTYVYNMQDYSRISSCEERESKRYFPVESAIMAAPNSQLVIYADCDEFDDIVRPAIRPKPSENECSFQPVVGIIVPESFEEQMVLAMASSMVEVRASTRIPKIA